MRKAGGRVVLVAGLLALLFGVIRGYEISVHVDVEQHNREQPKFVSHRELPSKEGKKAAESRFEFWVLSQIWPGSYCKRAKACCDHVEEPARFVVRGFWPDYSDYQFDSCCSGAPSFNASIENSAMAPLLKRYWPQLTCTIGQCNAEDTYTYWQYQWEKDGTCAYPTIPDSTTYFMEGLTVSLQYDLLLYLQTVGGIVPDNTKRYESSKAVALVKGWVGSTPRLLCYTNGELFDIWICLSKDLKFQDCPSGSPYSCPDEFLFPPFQKKQATPHLWNVS